ncbi:MAG: hypothetical protein H7A23_20950 [Leptospiraceae bacterium]|nr:hypothetical protein [Leptospiraceae bacterium]
MKSLLCILVVSLSFHNCKTEKKNIAGNFMESFFYLFILDGYLWVNVCPPKNATLTQGTHTITLNEGEEYWFDVNTNSKPRSEMTYEVGIIESTGQTLSVGNPKCTRNGQIFNPSEVKAEGEKPETYENGFWIYVFIFRNSRMAGIKSVSGSGEVKIKVP